MRYIINYIIIVSILSCANDKSKFKEKLVIPEEVELKFHSSVNNRYLFNNTREMFLTDNLVIITNEDDSSFCQIFDKLSGKHIGGYFKKGQGPFEITTASSVDYNVKDRVLSIYDANAKKCVYFKIDNLKNPVYKEINLNRNYRNNYLTLQALRLDNGFFLTKGNMEGSRYGLIEKDNSINLNIKYPKIANNKEVNQAVFSYASQWRMTPDNTKLISATYIGLVIELFNYKNKKLTPTTTKYIFKPIYKAISSTTPKWVIPTNETKRGVKALYVTNRNIFFVFEGIVNQSTGPELNSIYSLNWKGDFLKEYKFPKGIFPISIAFDENSQKFYCITLSVEGEYAFNRYSVK